MARRFILKRSLSLVHILAIVIMLSVSIWNFAVYFNGIRGKTAEQIELQKTKVEMTLVYLPKFFERGFEDVAIDYIEAGKVSNYFDFFVLKKNGRVLINSSNLENLDTKYIKEGALNQEIKTPGLTIYVSKKTMEPYEVTLGYFPANNDIFTKENVMKVLQANVLDSLVFFAAIVLLGMKGFFKQTNLILSGRREELEKLNPTTVEGKLLKNLFLHASSLTKKGIDLEIPDGIEVELTRGTVVGTTFSAGIIRIDLNSYTALCEKFGAGTMDSLLSPIFTEFREIAQRYNFYEVADGGDERVFYSRNEGGDITNRALSAIRGMFDIGKKHSPEYFEKFGFELNFKASFANGNLSLKKEDGKNKLKGDAYTYSQRCIEIFKDRKEKNYIVSLPVKDLKGAEWMAEILLEEQHNLKGLGSQNIAFISEHQSEPSEPSQFKYYLSNNDLTKQFKKLLKSWNTDHFWALYNSLKYFKSYLKDGEHKQLLFSLFHSNQSANNQVANSESENILSANLGDDIVASLLMMVPKLTLRADLNESELQILKSFLTAKGTRVKANALESLGELGVFASESKGFLKSSDSRSRANALVIVGKNEIGHDLQVNLKELLASKIDQDVLSGLYAIERLFQHHENQDLTLFKTATFFSEIFREVVRLKEDHQSSEVKKKTTVLFDTYKMHFT